MELVGLQRDLPELIHMLHVTKRPSTKEVIQADIDLILAKMESLRGLLINKFETKIS
jgi:hypothetical protein